MNQQYISAESRKNISELRSKLNSLLDSASSLMTIQPNTTSVSDMITKFSTLQARISSFKSAVNRIFKDNPKSLTIEPYACLTDAERIPNIFLRTRTLPEMESNLRVDGKKDHETLEQDLSDENRVNEMEYNSILEYCDNLSKNMQEFRNWLEETSLEYRFNQRYVLEDESPDTEEIEGPDPNERKLRHKEQALESILKFIHCGELTPLDLS